TGTQVASTVFTFEAPGRRFPSLFVIGGQPRQPHTVADLEKGILEELERLGKEPVTDQELAKVRAQIESDSVYDMRSNMGLAGALTQFAVLTGDWRNMMRRDEQLKAVTAAQVQEVA